MVPELFEACMSGDEQALLALIQHDRLILDRVVTSGEETPLHVAALRGHLSLVKTLLSLKPKLASEADATGCLPLHLASAEGSAEIVRELLRANANLCRTRDHCGRTPLYLGVMKGRLDVVRELIRACPASASERLDRGETVFHLSIRYCRFEVLKLLVDLLKDDHPQLLVATDDEGNTVLHFGAFFKQIETIRYLISLEGVTAIANTTNGSGQTAVDVIERSPRDFYSFEILETLTRIGVQRENNPIIVVHSTPRTTTNSANMYTNILSRMKRRSCHVLAYLVQKYQMDWIADAHGNLMVVATLIAGIAFQAGINPPGGVWQADTIDNHTCTKPDMCRAGTAVFKDTNEFRYFYWVNTWAFMAAVGVVLLHFGGLPLKNRVGTWLVTIATCFMLDNILEAYISSATMIFGSPGGGENETLVQIHYAWTYMLIFIVIIHTTRIWYWLMVDKVMSFVRPESTFLPWKLITTVYALIGTSCTLYVLYSMTTYSL